jgi:hypothetical protein
MGIRTRLLCLAPLLLLAAAAATLAQEGPPASPGLTVLDTDPTPPQATLGRSAAFYIRYRVDTAEPVSVEIEAYEQGQRVSIGNSRMSGIPAGGGTNASFFFVLSGKRQAVDEVRLVVSDAQRPPRRWTFPVPVALTFDPAMSGPAPAVAPWVTAWQQQRKAEMGTARRAEAQREAQHPFTELGLRILIGLLVLGLPVASLVLPIWALWRWQGGWRILAAIPTAVVALKIASVLLAVSRDPTSHNLWPLEIALWEIPALALLALLWLARRLAPRFSGDGPGV